MARNPSDLSTARLAKERALARVRLAQAASLEGKLLPRDLVQATWATAFASLRDRCLGVPDRVAERGANRTADELRVILEDEMQQVLLAVSSGQF
jgi:hypothetical protein